jgi:hypothetical protein
MLWNDFSQDFYWLLRYHGLVQDHPHMLPGCVDVLVAGTRNYNINVATDLNLNILHLNSQN